MKYFFHNTIGHPLMAVAQAAGYRGLSIWLHHVTLPNDAQQKQTIWDFPIDNLR